MRNLSEEFLQEQLPGWPTKAPARPSCRFPRAVLIVCGALATTVVVVAIAAPMWLSLLAAPAAVGWVLVVRQSPRSRQQRARHRGRRR